MAAPLTVRFIRDFDYLQDDRLQLEVDSALQPDSVTIWTVLRDQLGWGRSTDNNSGFGFATGLAWGAGAFGAGYFGQGAEIAEHRSVRSFVAGDYTIRMRGIDPLGNLGNWSISETLEHRPAPPPPFDLAMSGNTITWDWSDP